MGCLNFVQIASCQWNCQITVSPIIFNREGVNGGSKQNICKLNSSPRLPDKGVTKDAIVPGTGNNIKDLNNFG